jgi:hypothetical protein
VTDESRLTEEEWRDSTMSRIDVNLQRIVTDLDRIKHDLDDRPRAHEVTRARRGSVLLMMLALLGAVFVLDEHVERCGPGHRSEYVLEALVTSASEGRRMTPEEFQRVVTEGTPSDWCGITFPLHTHDSEGWPQRQHALGFAIYAAAVLGGILWWRWPLRQEAAIVARKEAEHDEDEDLPEI